MAIRSPFCSRLRRKPAYKRALDENGGVFTAPNSQISGLSFGLIGMEYMPNQTYLQIPPNQAL